MNRSTGRCWRRLSKRREYEATDNLRRLADRRSRTRWPRASAAVFYQLLDRDGIAGRQSPLNAKLNAICMAQA